MRDNYTETDDTYRINCTGDVVRGDVIKFDEAMWGGTHRTPKFAGIRTIVATVISDSYGASKQQHTFTLRVISCVQKMSQEVGMSNPPAASPDPGSIIKRKGRNIYRMDTYRKPWDNEDARVPVLAEKHRRGDEARDARSARRSSLVTM